MHLSSLTQRGRSATHRSQLLAVRPDDMHFATHPLMVTSVHPGHARRKHSAGSRLSCSCLARRTHRHRTAPHRHLRHHITVWLAQSESAADADRKDAQPVNAVKTLALLELLLAHPNTDQGSVPTHTMPCDSLQTMSDVPPEADVVQPPDRLLSQQGSEQSFAPSNLWSEAWQPLEVGQSPQAKPPTADLHQNPVALSSLLFGRRQKQQQQQQRQQQWQRPARKMVSHPKGLAVATLMKNAQMHLQGLEPAARLQLLVLCMASLEKLTSLLRDHAVRLTSKEWAQLWPAVLAVCSVQAATSWLGYCPGELLKQARQVVNHLDRGCSGNGTETPLSTALLHLTQTLSEAANGQNGLQRSASAEKSTPAATMQRPANTALTSEESPATSDTTPEDGTGSAWQSATENAVLHAAVLRHMCQQSDDAETRAQLEAGTAMPSTVRQQPPEAVQQQDSHQLPAQSVRDGARLRLAGRHKPVGVHTSHSAARQQRKADAQRLLLQSAPSVLQDMAANAAEAAAVCYLAEARSGLRGALEDEEWWPFQLHPSLRSTRSLERFRNQVSLNRLVHQNFHSVANIYEDRHQLCGFGPQAELLQQSVKARRVKELEALNGWKYIVSLLLEAGDIALPIFKSCMARVSAAISWLLVKLIGRALGLIYRGVKQSLVPQRPKQRKTKPSSADREGPPQWMPRFT